MAAANTETAPIAHKSPLSPQNPNPPASDRPEKGNPNSNTSKPAWKQPPANGPAATAIELGADAWPALSESAKTPSKTSSKVLDGSSSSSVSVGSTISSPTSKLSSSNPNPNPIPIPNPNPNPNAAPNRATAPVRQKSMKRSPPPVLNGGPTPQSPVAATSSPVPHANSEVPFPENPANTNTNTNTGGNNNNNSSSTSWEQNSHNNHRRGYYGGNNNRRGSGGVGNGGRRNHEYSGFDGYHHQNQHHRPRGMRPHYMRAPPPPVVPPVVPPPPPPPFIGPPPQGRPYGSPLGFHEMGSPVYYFAGPPPPFVGHSAAAPPTMLIPAIEPQRAMLLMQIDYYFSSENLCRDIFLRKNMDEEGWVPISLIAGFNKVKQITNNVQFIIDTVQLSNVVELQGDKIRKRNDWMNWILPPDSNLIPSSTFSAPSSPNINNLTSHFQSIGIVSGLTGQQGISAGTSTGSGTTNRLPANGDLGLTRSATSGNLNGQAQSVVGPTNQVIATRTLVRSDTL